MCGISGIVTAQGPASADELGRMTSLIEYRGPDGFGYLGHSTRKRNLHFTREIGELSPDRDQDYDVLLGHRRLAIIDLSDEGRCPMPSADHRLWITFNGEIYNYVELRAELAALGHLFTTATDTEVILAAYRQWGTGCLDHFNGMWSFALLDVDKAILFCARDRLGEKPFYYHWDGRTFSFGSEIKQLLCLPRVSREAHPGVLFDFLIFSTYGCNSEQTFFRDVMDMRGGHYLLVPLGAMHGWRPRPVRWWTIELRNKLEGWSSRQYADRYRELFEDAVRLRLRSDVPVGSCLSGGLDSSGIVCMVDRVLKDAGVRGLQKTFTALSDVKEYDERNYAQAVIDATRVQPSFVTPSVDRLLSDMDRLFWHQDEPFISTSIFAGWCVYGLVREHGVTVTLDGQGPDEMMGGYVPTMYPSLLLDNLSRLDVPRFLGNIQGLHRMNRLSWATIVAGIAREGGSVLIPRALKQSIRRAKEILTPEFFALGRESSVSLRRLVESPDWRLQVGGTIFDRVLLQATLYDTLPGILRQVDRNSMAFSVEARLPFLDYRLVEYTFSLPTRQKFDLGLPKQVYRRALDGVVPDVIRDRKSKLGFVTAEADWFRGGFSEALQRTYDEIPEGAPYRRAPVQSLFSSFVSGKTPYDPLLWKVFNIQRLQAAGYVSWPGANSPATRAPAARGGRRSRVCMISPGVVHALPRVLAMAPYLEEVYFVDLIGNTDPAVLEAVGVTYQSVVSGGGGPGSDSKLAFLLRNIDPDVICCHYALGDHFFQAIASNLCPVAVIAMGTDVLHDEGDVRRSWMERRLAILGMKNAGRIAAKSHHLEAAIRKMSIQSPVDVNYWGCNLRQFTPGSRLEARAQLGLPASPKILLSPRAIEPRLNIHLIVEAFPAVLRRWPDALLVFIGRADLSYHKSITQTIARLGIGSNVRFCGFVPMDQTVTYYRASDLVISLGNSEGFPNTLLEVMACGIPILAADIPQVRELLIDGVNASVSPLQVTAIESGIVRLLEDSSLAAGQAVAAQAAALEVGNIASNAQLWSTSLLELARSGKRPSATSIWLFRGLLLVYRISRALSLRLS